jgi:hypothetical protein
VPLKIAAKVDAVDRDYFDSEIRKLLTPPDVEYIGEISDGDDALILDQLADGGKMPRSGVPELSGTSLVSP